MARTTTIAHPAAYELFAIPEHRCPECGVNFDRTGIVRHSIHDRARACDTMRHIVRGTASSIACTVVACTPPMVYGSLLSTLVVAIALIAAAWIKLRCCDHRSPSVVAWTVYPAVAMLVTPALIVSMVLVPPIAGVFAAAFLLHSWLLFLIRVSGSHAYLNLDKNSRPLVLAGSETARTWLTVATLAMPLGWL